MTIGELCDKCVNMDRGSIAIYDDKSGDLLYIGSYGPLKWKIKDALTLEVSKWSIESGGGLKVDFVMSIFVV